MNTFDPASIPKYAVIILPFQFSGSAHRISKFFVVLSHQRGHAICLKATSQVNIYLNNKEQMAGCVFYEAGKVKCFKNDTAIQPDNQIPISHDELKAAQVKGELEIMETLPADFEEKLRKAIQDSVTISGREKKRILQILETVT
jgi:hypothetical protein